MVKRDSEEGEDTMDQPTFAELEFHSKKRKTDGNCSWSGWMA